MPLKLTVDTLDGIDESLRSLYVERDGKFHLDVDGVEDTSGLRSALGKERHARSEAEKAAARWKALGKSPEDIQDLLEAQQQAEEDRAAKAGEWDKLRAQMNDRHEAALKAEGEKVAKMRGTLERYLVDAAATGAIAEANGSTKLLLPHVQAQVKVAEINGEYIAQVVDAKGDPRVNGKGEPLTIGELVAEMRQSADYGSAFKADDKAGGGKPPGSMPTGGPGGNKPRSKMSLEEKSDFIEKNGPEAYQSLPF